ncbi:Hypothetical protein D9617_7g030400 [Elsinoe fawcettii]|nr:Hypothetical protein D9617_7g030400 [Elsinoe fawcettii]
MGYADYSDFISASPELANFEKFERLSLQNLVYYQDALFAAQAELNSHSAEELKALRTATVEQEYDIRGVSGSWALFKQGAIKDERVRRKKKLVKKIRRLTREYQEALRSHSRTMALPAPSPDIHELQKLYLSKEAPFFGPGADLATKRSTLASLAPPSPDHDLLTRLTRFLFGRFCRDARPPPAALPEIRFYKDNSIRRLTTLIGVALAIFLLFGATVVLTFATGLSKVEQMAVIGAFTSTFAILVGIFTNCKKSELFVAVATYSAVLVVFAEVTKESSSG